MPLPRLSRRRPPACEAVNVSTSRSAVPLMCEKQPYIKVLTAIATLRRTLGI